MLKGSSMKKQVRAIPSALILIFLAFSITVIAQSPLPYTIAGDLRNEGGQLSSGATVCALQTNGKVVNVRDRVCVESDAQGKFVINLAGTGIYQVIAEKTSEGYMPPYIPYYKDPKTPIPEVTVGAENP